MLTPAQDTLLQHLKTVLEADARVDAAWLSGSLGKDEGDAWSDVDVTVVVEEDDIGACVAEYGGPKSPVGPAALVMVLYGRVVSTVTPQWQRYDLTFLTEPELRRQGVAGLKPLTAGAKPPPGAPTTARPAPPKSPQDLVAGANEFLRVLGLAPVMVGRQEWLVGQEGYGLLKKALIDLMVEANGLSGARGGVKRLRAFLTDEQRLALEALPSPGANQAELMAANVAVTRLYLPLAKRLLGDAWPAAFEAATAAHLKAELGFDL